MSEKIKISEYEGIPNNPDESTSQEEFPPFDPEKAHHNLQNATETEKQPLSPEEFKDTAKMIEQLEKMGVNPKIADNPAFQRMVDARISRYGLRASRRAEVTSGSSSSDNTLGIRSTCEKGDSDYHDRGQMNFIVKEDGSVTVECAYVDRESRHFEGDAFKGYDGPKDGDGSLQAIGLENQASITEFKVSKNGALQSIERNVREEEYAPEGDHQKKIWTLFLLLF